MVDGLTRSRLSTRSGARLCQNHLFTPPQQTSQVLLRLERLHRPLQGAVHLTSAGLFCDLTCTQDVVRPTPVSHVANIYGSPWRRDLRLPPVGLRIHQPRQCPVNLTGCATMWSCASCVRSYLRGFDLRRQVPLGEGRPGSGLPSRAAATRRAASFLEMLQTVIRAERREQILFPWRGGCPAAFHGPCVPPGRVHLGVSIRPGQWRLR